MKEAKTDFVFVRLVGGLGNQLFQYATARAVALRNGVPLILDARAYKSDSAFGYRLGHFAIEARPGSSEELPPGKDEPIRYALWRKFGSSPKFARERGLGFNRSVIALPAGVYLHGYFQSEKYFADIAEHIRAELTLKEAATGKSAEWLDQIDTAPSVSLHVRRGDYVSSTKAAATHGTCSPDYYRNAVARMADQAGIDPVIFIFSDDPDWAREKLELPFETHIVTAGGAAHEDLRLMSACRHHVIANSSFSWWGAWLNPKPDKIVVAPDKWFADSRMDNPDIVPEGWVRIGD
jgi:hypothetical protein